MNQPFSIEPRKKSEESLHRLPHIPEQSTGEKKVLGERLGRKRSLVFIVLIVIFTFSKNLSWNLSMFGVLSSSILPAHIIAKCRAASFLGAHELKTSSAKTLETFKSNFNLASYNYF